MGRIMQTKRIYKENVYLKEYTSKITGIFQEDGKLTVTLDETIFAPTGGGQSCDIGNIAGYQVVDVHESENEIFHQLMLENDDTQCKLVIGNEVDISIDWNHRFDNMQRHCGEHILSGMFYREYGGVNRGFHMGENYMTIDISLEENPEFTEITWDMAKHIELCANQAVWSNLPVITRHYDDKSETSKLPLRKALAFDEDITIVCVGDINNPSDCVACCGTHPSSAGQVGLIKIYKVEVNKNMYRIYFEAGKRAFLQYQEKHDVLTSIENKLSAGTDDLLSKYQAQQDKNKEVRSELYYLKKWVITAEIDGLSANLGNTLVKYYDILSIDDILTVGRALSDEIPKILFLVHNPSHTILLFSNGKGLFDCGKLVKDNANIYGGKGGGNQTSARAIFSKKEYIDTFIDLVCKHLGILDFKSRQ